MRLTVPQPQELIAPAGWRTVDFLSDLHLHEADSATFNLWRKHLLQSPADAIFLLGDVFEVWIGDDAVSSESFEAHCLSVIKQASAAHDMFFMAGNRDFLVGPEFARACGANLLLDPTVLSFMGKRWLLSHGDALCLDDLDYMRFRAEVRTLEWRQQFLDRPLAERASLAKHLRNQSEARKHATAIYADLDPDATRHWLQSANAETLIHGHTHRPQRHDLGGGQFREVLSDWDAMATPPRAQVLRLDALSLTRITCS
jgi:UDP-2,3-diacylglucosamine hydrolase